MNRFTSCTSKAGSRYVSPGIWVSVEKRCAGIWRLRHFPNTDRATGLPGWIPTSLICCSAGTRAVTTLPGWRAKSARRAIRVVSRRCGTTWHVCGKRKPSQAFPSAAPLPAALTTAPLSPRRAAYLLLRPADENDDVQRIFLKEFFLLVPELRSSVELFQAFAAMVRERQSAAFDDWLQQHFKVTVPPSRSSHAVFRKMKLRCERRST